MVYIRTFGNQPDGSVRELDGILDLVTIEFAGSRAVSSDRTGLKRYRIVATTNWSDLLRKVSI